MTPVHFLIGAPLTAYPDTDLTDIPGIRLSLYQKMSHIRQTFWKRWSTKYLNLFQNKPNWFHAFSEIKTDDLALLKEDKRPPLK